MSMVRVFVVLVLALLQICPLYGALFDKGGHNATSKARNYFKSGFTRTNANSVEVMLLYREQELFQQTVASAVAKGYTIQGFYHTSTWQPKWAEVILEQLRLLDGQRRMPKEPSAEKTTYSWHPDTWASLLSASTNLHLNVAGPTKEDAVKVQKLVDHATLTFKNKITVHYNQTVTREAFGGADEEKKKSLIANPELSSGEHSTVDTLHNYCIDKAAKGEKALVYYMHSKSGCCYKDPFGPKEKMPRASWREEMNAFNVEFPSICLRALLKGYNTCGVENQDAHYSGNFWWADCAHIASLSKPDNRFDAWSAEFFVQKYSVDHSLAKRIGYHCGYSAWNCGLNLYDFDCERDMYRDRLFKLVMSSKLAPSMRGKQHTNDTQRCVAIRGKKYNDNQVDVREAFKGVN